MIMLKGALITLFLASDRAHPTQADHKPQRFTFAAVLDTSALPPAQLAQLTSAAEETYRACPVGSQFCLFSVKRRTFHPDFSTRKQGTTRELARLRATLTPAKPHLGTDADLAYSLRNFVFSELLKSMLDNCTAIITVITNQLPGDQSMDVFDFADRIITAHCWGLIVRILGDSTIQEFRDAIDKGPIKWCPLTPTLNPPSVATTISSGQPGRAKEASTRRSLPLSFPSKGQCYAIAVMLDASQVVPTIWNRLGAEPVLDFDTDVMRRWVEDINPCMVWLGYDSRRNHLPEPELEKVKSFYWELGTRGFIVVLKKIRPAWWENE